MFVVRLLHKRDLFLWDSFAKETSISLNAHAIILPSLSFVRSFCSVAMGLSIQSPMSAPKSPKSAQKPISAPKSTITAQKSFVTVQKTYLCTGPDPSREMRSARCFGTCARRPEIPHDLSSTGARRSTSCVRAISCVATYLEEEGIVRPMRGPAIVVTPVFAFMCQ